MEIILFLAGVFLLTFLVGKLFEKIRIPWIFSALLIGLFLSVFNPFTEITNSQTFNFLAELGMLFLLFIIGFELNIKQILSQGKFIFKTTGAIILAESFFGSILIHYLFDISWPIALLVASSFATVGEAVLLPILEEFKLIKTKIGQTILGVGVLDDFVEIITIVVASVVIGKTVGHSHNNIFLNLLLLASLIGVVFMIIKFHKKLPIFKFKDLSLFFIFTMFFFFMFIGVGKYVESGALGALLAGIALRNIIPPGKLKLIESKIKTISYGLFAPIFFLSVGLSTDVIFLLRFPLLIVAVVLMTNFAKILSCYLVGRKVMGAKKSIFLGVSLTVKFSTSIVIIKMLADNGIIPLELYSVLVGTTIAFIIVPVLLLSKMVTKWHLH